MSQAGTVGESLCPDSRARNSSPRVHKAPGPRASSGSQKRKSPAGLLVRAGAGWLRGVDAERRTVAGRPRRRPKAGLCGKGSAGCVLLVLEAATGLERRGEGGAEDGSG